MRRCHTGWKGMLLGGVLLATVWAASAAEPAFIPRMRIPKVVKPPTLDGVIQPGEWAAMSAFTGFQDYQMRVALPVEFQPVWWMGYDDQYLYVAQRYPLYPKGAIKAAMKLGDRGGIAQEPDAILSDDHVEIQICNLPDRGMALNNYFYKIMVNPYGAVVDHRPELKVGWYGFEWESGAQVKSKVTDDAWTFEMAVPLRNLGYKGPVPDGTRWFMQLASAPTSEAYYFAWVPVGWTVFDLFPEIVFDATAPAVQMPALGELMDGKLDLPIEVTAAKAGTVTVTVEVTDATNGPLFRKDVQVEARPGATAQGRITADLPIVADPVFKWGGVRGAPYQLRYQAATTDGRVLYENRIPFVKRPADLKALLYDALAASKGKAGEPQLKTVYYHTARQLEVFVDTDILGITPVLRAATRYRVFVRNKAESKPRVEAHDYILPNGAGHLVIGLPALEDGDYEAGVEVLGEGDQVLASKLDPFTVRPYAWQLSQAGTEPIVVAPFTPLAAAGRSLSAWGRTYTFGNDALPASLVSQNQEMLAGPATLTARINGRDEVLTPQNWPTWTTRSGHTCTLAAQNRLGPLAVNVEASTEYDGTMLYALTFTPVAPSRVDQMDLEIPLQGMDGYMLNRSGRDVTYGAIPDKDGAFWDSSKLATCPNVVGTFLPFAFVGDGERGLCWAADSDQGWMLDDAKPSFFLERRGQAVVLRARFCNQPTQLWAPRTIRFMLQALPAKPLPPDYRYRAWGYGQVGALSCFWAYGTGPVISFYKPEHFEVFADLIRKEKAEAWRAITAKPGPRHAPLSRWYVATNTKGLAEPDYDTYSGEWLGTTWKKPQPEAHYVNATNAWTVFREPRQQCRAYADLVQSTVDCRVHNFDQQQKQCDLNGYWWDHDRFWSSGNLIKGTAYTRDDGTVQGTFNIGLMRQMMKRMATCAELNGVRPWHGYYAPNNVGPIGAFMQYNWAVESFWYMRGKDLDLFDNLNAGIAGMKVLAGRYTGNPTLVTSLTWESGYPGLDTDLKRYPFQSRSVHGACLLMDIGVTEGRTSRDEYARLYQCLTDFDYFNAAVAWVPFWRSGDLVKTGRKDVVCTVYRRTLPGIPRAALLVVFNTGDKEAAVNLATADATLIGQAGARLTDVEAKTAIARKGSDWAEMVIKRHDYRLLVLE